MHGGNAVKVKGYLVNNLFLLCLLLLAGAIAGLLAFGAGFFGFAVVGVTIFFATIFVGVILAVVIIPGDLRQPLVINVGSG